ncbi:MAG: peptidylprolyl isomerase [Gallionella sp.]
MKINLSKLCLSALFCLVVPVAVHAEAQVEASPVRQGKPIDAVAVVVNNDVITQNELSDKLRATEAQLKAQGTPLPAHDVLEKQMLERMISDMLQLQFAAESGIRVDDSQLDAALSRIAEQNKFASLTEFRARLSKDGINFEQYREEIRNEMIFTRVREREIESKLTISDGEVDAYLANQAKIGNNKEEFHLAHILVVVPEQASADKIKASLERADLAYKQLQGGADFAQVAAGTSDAKDALKGGDLGWRAADRLPPAFMEILNKLKPGENTEVMRSTSGFHILKLIAKRSANAPVVITQTHARHILIKTSEIVPEADAKKRIMEIKQRIEVGADFAEQAKRYSEDGSAQQGGDLDWLSPGQTVGGFEEAMNKLKPNQIGLAQTQFGWHLIQVIERRDTDVSEQQKRQQARSAIGTFKSDELYQDWLRQLRDRAFIEYHNGTQG